MSRKKNKALKPGKQQKPKSGAGSTLTSTRVRKASGNAPFFMDFRKKISWKTDALLFLLFVVITLVLYSGDLKLGFFSVDDSGYIIDNPWIKEFSFHNLSFVLTQPYFANYSPVHLISYLIDFTIAGQDPYAFHLSSNMWGGVAAGLVYLVSFRLIRDRLFAVLAALLFTFHPAHVEAIAWISSRKDIIAAVFALLCFLAYFKYRNNNPAGKRWYILSLVFFVLAVGGKLSVVTFPAVLFAYDLFVEKRSFLTSLFDKLPFLLIGVGFTIAVFYAQPSTGNTPDPFVFLGALGQGSWLLTGFGEYVLNRVPPQPGGIGLKILALLILISIFFLPLLLRRRFPLITVLIYWILVTYLPSQALSFVHPVTDRYLFMPSIAFSILLAWAAFQFSKKDFRNSLAISVLALIIITFFWGRTTISYLREWQDPRSVWFAAIEKSKDPDAFYSLGEEYMTLAAQLGTTPRGNLMSYQEKEELASKVWDNDPRLPDLLTEWRNNKAGGPMEKSFQSHLRNLSEDAFNTALQRQGTRAMPHLYFRMGLLFLDRGDYERANKEFLAAINEVSRYTVVDVGNELIVASYRNLGISAMNQGDYRNALKWYRLCEETQNKLGGNWVRDITEQRKKMETTVSMLPGSNVNNPGTNDPLAAYNLGLDYLNIANALGSAPASEKARFLANEVWKNDPRLTALLNEWSAGRQGGETEKLFKEYLKRLAWEAFEKSLKSKGNTINSNLYFRRGMLLGDWGDIGGARDEFTSALKEASLEQSSEVKQGIIVTSHDALGILAWREKKYREALKEFQIALEEQKKFGGNWVPDLESKCRQMESMSN